MTSSSGPAGSPCSILSLTYVGTGRDGDFTLTGTRDVVNYIILHDTSRSSIVLNTCTDLKAGDEVCTGERRAGTSSLSFALFVSGSRPLSLFFWGGGFQCSSSCTRRSSSPTALQAVTNLPPSLTWLTRKPSALYFFNNH